MTDNGELFSLKNIRVVLPDGRKVPVDDWKKRSDYPVLWETGNKIETKEDLESLDFNALNKTLIRTIAFIQDEKADPDLRDSDGFNSKAADIPHPGRTSAAHGGRRIRRRHASGIRPVG